MNFKIFEFVLYDKSILITPWTLLGMFGALMFGSRWVVQAYYSRKKGYPATPRLFWIMSLTGSLTTFTYFVCSPKQDMVGVIQNFFPVLIAAYNLYLYRRWERQQARVSPVVCVPSETRHEVIVDAPQEEVTAVKE